MFKSIVDKLASNERFAVTLVDLLVFVVTVVNAVAQFIPKAPSQAPSSALKLVSAIATAAARALAKGLVRALRSAAQMITLSSRRQQRVRRDDRDYQNSRAFMEYHGRRSRAEQWKRDDAAATSY